MDECCQNRVKYGIKFLRRSDVHSALNDILQQKSLSSFKKKNLVGVANICTVTRLASGGDIARKDAFDVDGTAGRLVGRVGVGEVVSAEP